MIPHGIEDRYDIVQVLQETAATAVLLVNYRQIGALRILKAVHRAHPNAHSILSEAHLLQGIDSSQIPTIYSVEDTNEMYYLVEEFVEGLTLREFLLETTLSKEELLKIAISLCEVIEAMHNAKDGAILYRDMKPEHIILQGDRVRLIDFGISIRKSEADLARPFGTKSWAAPEQLNGSTLDERCDVYSVGRIIEYMQKNSYAKDDYKIKKILAQATEENVIERTSSITVLKNQLAELNDKNYKSRTKGNLDKRIAVVGSHPSVGTTMIAIRMCRYLNRKGACAFYQDVEGDTVHNLLKNLNHTRLKDGILYHEDFKGILNYDEAIEISKPPRGLFIKDCGTNIEKAVDSDFIIFVTSLCPWQSPVYPSWISSESVYVLSNISTKLATIKLAKKLKKKVYMYPRIKSVFKSDIDEERIFSAILKNEKDEYF